MSGPEKSAVGILILKSAGLLFTTAKPRPWQGLERTKIPVVTRQEDDDLSDSGEEDDEDDDVDETLDRVEDRLDDAARYGAEKDTELLELKRRFEVLSKEVKEFGETLPDEDEPSQEQTTKLKVLSGRATLLEDDVRKAFEKIGDTYGGAWAKLARQAAEYEIAKLSTHQARLANISNTNPVAKVQKRLTLAIEDAAGTENDSERARKFEEIQVDAKDQLGKCRECKDAETVLNRATVEMKLVFDRLELVQVQQQQPQRGWVKADPSQTVFNTANRLLVTALATAKDLADLKLKLEAAVPKVNEAKQKIEAAVADKQPLEAQKLAAQAAIEAASAAIDGIASKEVGPGLRESLTLLIERRRVAALEPDGTPARTEFYAIVKAARALNDEARTALYKEKAATEEGRLELDKLIDEFGDKAAGPLDQATCRAALAARFDLAVKIPDGLSVELLPRLYKLFQQLPEDHAVHDKMKTLEYGTETGDAHYYQESGKRIVLLASLSEDGDKVFASQETGAEQTVKRFNATVLHEIGHGVDAKKAVTEDPRMKKSGFGQWRKESLGSVVAALYDAAFAKYTGSDKPATEGDLKAMLTRLLTAGACAQPASAEGPLGSLFAGWSEISNEPAFKWCPSLRDGQQPWTQKHEIDGRVYQECYEDDWWSYDLNDRQTTGISDYQWRARPEWFAEAYALYHMNKIQKFPSEIDEFVIGKPKDK